MPPSRSFAIPFLVCCTGVALFAMMDGVMKGLSLSIGLYNALFWRALAGSLLGLALMIATRQTWPSRRVLRLHLIRGLAVSLMAPLFFYGLMHLPLAEGIALSFISPLIALYLAALLLGEPVERQAIGASLLGLVGVGVILSGRISGQYDRAALLGAVAILFSALLFAWNLILQRQQAQLASPVEIAFFQHIVMLGVFAPGAFFWVEPPPSGAAPLVLLAAGLAFTSLALLAWAYARSEAQRLIPVEYSAFLWAALVGWLLFDEQVTPATLAGAGLIVAGCLIASRIRCNAAPHVEAGVA
ncbi:S-adenosylmethionine uptake transporter [Sphingobium faniae]|nr:S-adenosylmethionine uptake transporter [Sphingobium faniae]